MLGPWESYGFDPWDESRCTGQLNQLNQLNVGQIYHIWFHLPNQNQPENAGKSFIFLMNPTWRMGPDLS